MVWSRCWPASAVFSLPPRSCPRRRGQPLPGRTARSPSSAEAIYSANPDGTQRADSGKWADSPAWSPDGSQIAYSTGSTVAVMNADGSRVHRVADGITPAWSPDGKKLAYTCNNGVRFGQICTVKQRRHERRHDHQFQRT
ncbi:MAG: PD40 domain-containing protein [Actinobacteria bacterium]|nr:PD40 domain-containing protein [Actinomycetota bacterium]